MSSSCPLVFPFHVILSQCLVMLKDMLLQCLKVICFFLSYRYFDPEAVVGCEDGTARVFDMYSRKCSQIIRYLLSQICSFFFF